MKKTILLLSMIFAVVANISAQSISISATSDGKTYTSTGEIKASTETKPRTATFYIKLSGASTTETAAFQYDINVPKGYKVDESSFGLSNVNLTAAAFSATRISGNNDYDGPVYRVVYGKESTGENFNGEIGHFTVSVDKTLEGDNQVFTVDNFIISKEKKSSIYNADMDVDISVGTYTTISVSNAKFTVTQPSPVSATLDENSELSITEQLKKWNISLGQEIDNLTIKRTINPGNWGTLVLPVPMTASEVKEVFGESSDVTFADLKGFGIGENIVENIPTDWIFYTKLHTGALAANTIYYVKSNKKISQIVLHNKTIVSDPEDNINTRLLTIYCTDGSTNNRTINVVLYYRKMQMEGGELFLNGNKYWFTSSQKQYVTNMKGFRASYSNVAVQRGSDVPTNILSSIKINTLFENSPITNGIIDINIGNNFSNYNDGKIYNLSGEYVGTDTGKLQRGIYIRNGKKIVIK